MKKLLISAGALTALALTSAPANAQAVVATSQADAHVRIYQPLTIASIRDLDFGTIVLGPGTYSDTVAVSQGSVRSGCVNVTCSGTPVSAQYTVTGTQDQDVSVFVSPTIALANQTIGTAPDLTLTVDAPGTVTLDGAGTVTFDIGGSIDVAQDTTEGVYLGTFDVSADYQ